MFEPCDSKCVRRSDLRSGSSSPATSTTDLAAAAQLQSHFAQTFATPTSRDASPNHVSRCSNHEDADAYAFEFRLFASSKSKAELEEQPRRIIIRSPTPTAENPGFINPLRPPSYYFTATASAQRKETFASAAVSGGTILAEARQRWPGAELKWRVTTIRMTGAAQSRVETGKMAAASDPTVERATKRKRAGKKRRIILRKRLATMLAERGATARRLLEQEAAEKEKRTRRNREKKVKKKEKEKAKKAEVVGHGVAINECDHMERNIHAQ